MKNTYSFLLKLIVVTIIFTIIFFSISNSYTSKNLDKLAYVVALGIDIGTNNNIRLSIELAKPSGGGSASSSESQQSTSSVVNSVECSTIQSGINLFNSYISRDINLAHCKIIAISEALAQKDISTYIYDLANNVEVSSHANIIITKCEAKSFLEGTNPVLESYPARYYDIVNTSTQLTGYTKATSLTDFFSEYIETTKCPTAVLANVNTDSTHTNFLSDSFENKDGSYIAGETPIDSTNNIENMGLAVFSNGRLVGELNGIESICHLIVLGEMKYCTIQITNPTDPDTDLSLRIKLDKKTKKDVKFSNDLPYANIKVSLNAQIVSSSNGDSGFSNRNQTEELEKEVSRYFEKTISKYLYKVSREYNADIDGFGRSAIKYFLIGEEWEKYSWLDQYENMFFDVKVSTKIRSSSNFING